MWRGGVLACLFCGTLALASASHAQPRSNHSDYPNKPIRIINTTSAGGPAEQVARIMGQRLTEAWGQQVVVDNRAGAAGTIGAEIVARAAPDGYTLLLGAGIPFGALNNIAQLVEHPQVKARGSMVDIDHPKIGKTRVVGPVAKLSETPATIRSLSPSLGEHTAEVLRDFLGMDAAAIAGLRADGVIAAEK